MGQKKLRVLMIGALLGGAISQSYAELIDNNLTPNTINAGINKSLSDEIGVGRGDIFTPNSSMFNIKRDPFRAIRRGRQLFQRKFTRAQGQGPAVGDGAGNIGMHPALGAGLSDSCSACHGRPRGSGGVGGDVATRPDSRDASHLFGLGLREMLADEITADLRDIRKQALSKAKATNRPVTHPLVSKTISYGSITANPDGTFVTTQVQGVNADLRVRPFFAQGGTISIREFIVGAAQGEMGLQAVDPDLYRAAINKKKIITPAGMVLDGSLDQIEAPPTNNPKADPDKDGVKNEMPESLVDYLEFYLLNYFKPATYQQTFVTKAGRALFMEIGCAKCHVPDLQIDHDRRLADVDTVYDPANGSFNSLFATATTSFVTWNDRSRYPVVKLPALKPYLVENIFTDFKRHDLGPNFWERNYDGTFQREFLTRPLWGVGTTAPYGHDGRSSNLTEVILRHGGEAQAQREAFGNLGELQQGFLLEFLNSLILFPPDDTASNLKPAEPNALNFPQNGHGSISLTVLFNDPSDLE